MRFTHGYRSIRTLIDGDVAGFYRYSLDAGEEVSFDMDTDPPTDRAPSHGGRAPLTAADFEPLEHTTVGAEMHCTAWRNAKPVRVRCGIRTVLAMVRRTHPNNGGHSIYVQVKCDCGEMRYIDSGHWRRYPGQSCAGCASGAVAARSHAAARGKRRVLK